MKQLVELHGGTVSVSSAGAGLGRDLRRPPPGDRGRCEGPRSCRRRWRGPRWRSSSSSDLSGVKVLVVDDEADARELVKRVLSECNADVVAAGSAEEALLLVEREQPNVLVSDIGMPGVDGYELLRRIRAFEHARGRRITAIALNRVRPLRGPDAGAARRVSRACVEAGRTRRARRDGRLGRGADRRAGRYGARRLSSLKARGEVAPPATRRPRSASKTNGNRRSPPSDARSRPAARRSSARASRARPWRLSTVNRSMPLGKLAGAGVRAIAEGDRRRTRDARCNRDHADSRLPRVDTGHLGALRRRLVGVVDNALGVDPAVDFRLRAGGQGNGEGTEQ